MKEERMSTSPSQSLATKKRLGAFYTPPEVSRILCEWAIRLPTEKILEPSFGGCGFLEASSERLNFLGNTNPNQLLYGCDIDQSAFQHLANKIGPTEISERFILSDFLLLSTDAFSRTKFEAIIGNPPYISHHNMATTQRENAYKAMKAGGHSISAKASLWAYFVVHSLQFLKEGGRMAWVLPGSFLYADYSKSIREIFAQAFERVLIISLGERVFKAEGTDEHSVLVLCENFARGPAEIGLEVNYASDTDCLESFVNEWQGGGITPNTFNGRFGLSMIPPKVQDLYSSIANAKDAVRFGEIAKVLIGIVTGDNKFFIINTEEAQSNNLTHVSLTPILSKFNMANGLYIGENDILEAKKANLRCLLVDTTKMRKNSRTLIQYLSGYSEDKKRSNKTFAKRTLWHRPDDGKVPDAFFPYMHHLGPRLVLNEAKLTCTNTVHRVFFIEMPRYKTRLAAISLLSSFSQVSAEIEGRCYGSGVLKHEPSEAKRILLLMSDNVGVKEVNEIYSKVDSLIRSRKHETARCLIDHFILKNHIERHGEGLLASLNSTLNELRSIRHQKRTGKNG